MKKYKISTDRIEAIKHINIDSIKNWLIKFTRYEPSTFLMPTSLALSVDLAIDRLMKLMDEMISIMSAMAVST